MQNKIRSVRGFAPATVANVSCGFDVLGFAVDKPGDEVVITLTSGKEVVIRDIIGDEGRLPRDAGKNTAGVAIRAMLKELEIEQGVDVVLYKNLPLGSGMGSSAASSVAALVALNSLLGNPFSKLQLLPFAMEAERIACGSAHADNVAPSLLGGFILIRGYSPLDVVTIPTPSGLYCTLIHPHLELNTEDSRQVLRQNISLKDAIIQWGNIAGLVAGMMKPDYGLIGRSLNDVIAEPVRALLIPGYHDIKKIAVNEGALGSGISGSGPAIFTLSTEKSIASRTGRSIQEHFAKYRLESEVYISKINQEGARIIDNPK